MRTASENPTDKMQDMLCSLSRNWSISCSCFNSVFCVCLRAGERGSHAAPVLDWLGQALRQGNFPLDAHAPRCLADQPRFDKLSAQCLARLLGDFFDLCFGKAEEVRRLRKRGVV